MSKSFYKRLQNYFADVGKVLKGEANAASIFPNTTDIGMSRERIYSEVLKSHLPSNCNVYYGGFVFNLEGNESKQIDLIIINDKAIRFNFHNQDGNGKSFACIEGCVGIASIKSNLNSAQIVDSLENIASLPDKLPMDGRSNILLKMPDKYYDDWPYKIIYASDGISPDSIHQTIEQFYRSNSEIPYYKRPNLIHVAGKYIFIRGDEKVIWNRGINNMKVPKEAYVCQTTSPDEYGLLWAINGIQQIVIASNQFIYSYGEMINKIQ